MSVRDPNYSVFIVVKGTRHGGIAGGDMAINFPIDFYTIM